MTFLPPAAFALGLVAGVLLGFGTSSVLFRFWAGTFLMLTLILESTAQLEMPEAVQRSSKGRILHLCGGALVGASVLLGAAFVAGTVLGPIWGLLLGPIAAASAAMQTAAFGVAKTQYVGAAGAGIADEREAMLELRLRRRRAELRNLPKQALLWRCYATFRQIQDYVSPDAPRGSADRFWQLNRWRMRAWTLLSPTMIFFVLAVSALLSAVSATAIPVALWLIVIGGNIMLTALLVVGWKTRPVNR